MRNCGRLYSFATLLENLTYHLEAVRVLDLAHEFHLPPDGGEVVLGKGHGLDGDGLPGVLPFVHHGGRALPQLPSRRDEVWVKGEGNILEGAGTRR